MIVIPKKFHDNLHYFEIQKGFGITKLYSFSDVHFDNALCNRELFEKHLKEAKKENGLMIFPGDFFCLMQGKYDPRSDKSALRTEHLGSGYLERVIDEAVEFMLPYAENILMFSLGNHETSVSNRIEINILKWFVDKLNSRAKTDIQLGAYAGYFVLSFNCSGRIRAVNVGYHHGAWGGVVSKGSQSVGRFGLAYPSADIFFSGHTHDAWVIPQPRLVLNKANMTIENKEQLHIKSGTYKEEFVKGKGWATQTIAMPKRMGGAFVEIEVTKKDINYRASLL